MTRTDILGETYIAVAGFPVETSEGTIRDCRRAIEFALELLNFVHKSGTSLDFRIGAHMSSAAVAYLETGVDSPGAVFSDVTVSPLDEDSRAMRSDFLASSTSKWFIAGDAIDVAIELKMTSKPGCIHVSDTIVHTLSGLNAFVVEGPEYIDFDPHRVKSVSGTTLPTYWILGYASEEVILHDSARSSHPNDDIEEEYILQER
ncbi:hypothetical protein M427DRAFT_224555 [Gonapodya prolifera JEL478]|uniref:Guanylate cyclase domain-containing protein n=1 Tax=Gonapodya prolifera (strain JEL478) TaxID=1344416 RepID=A0A139AND7_GONPJ|nr:hypothetical protein M427DRAFT_224555 [Gonapodya prolifera JEL478]|eukprot:KXS18228.1 hypothetical protein M427DRAFT_224555 [Gonapodya prolifera JEL478]